MTLQLAEVFLFVGVGIWSIFAKKVFLYIAVMLLGWALIVSADMTGYYLYGIGMIMVWAALQAFFMLMGMRDSGGQ